MESRLLFAGGPPSRLLAVANNKLANKCWPALTWRLTAPSAKKKKKKGRRGKGRIEWLFGITAFLCQLQASCLLSHSWLYFLLTGI